MKWVIKKTDRQFCKALNICNILIYIYSIPFLSKVTYCDSYTEGGDSPVRCGPARQGQFGVQ